MTTAPVTARQYNYTTLIILTVIVYDHILTFSREIKYVWSKPWTWVTLLFLLVRYIGPYSYAFTIILSSGIMPANKKSQGEIMFLFWNWVYPLFHGAADFMMILRIWAMYDQSRPILVVLFSLFSLDVISSILETALESVPRNLAATTLPGSSICWIHINVSYIWFEVTIVLRIAYGAVLSIFVIVQFVRQSLLMYRVTKWWKLNRYMNLLVKQGLIHFLVFFLAELINALLYFGVIPAKGWWQTTPLVVLEYLPIFLVPSRFALSIRELYAHDLRGRYGNGIDTGFGLSTDRGAIGTTIVFADVEEEEHEMLPIEGGMTQPEPEVDASRHAVFHLEADA